MALAASNDGTRRRISTYLGTKLAKIAPRAQNSDPAIYRWVGKPDRLLASRRDERFASPTIFSNTEVVVRPLTGGAWRRRVSLGSRTHVGTLSQGANSDGTAGSADSGGHLRGRGHRAFGVGNQLGDDARAHSRPGRLAADFSFRQRGHWLGGRDLGCRPCNARPYVHGSAVRSLGRMTHPRRLNV